MLASVILQVRSCGRNYLRSYSSMKVSKVKVPVKQGIVVGEQHRMPNGLEYESFLGVPYAEPPVGELRFRSPVPLERFQQHELDCSKHGDVSPQKDPFTLEVAGSENCLFLNVFKPKSTHSNSPLPVMVWVHGGGFFFGNGNRDFHFPVHLMEQGVVVVTLNYRLGALGFLSLPEEGIFGNAGLKDQRLALQWINQNIANFNGDPQNVTLFGESAGAASVHLHAYTKHANKLFHKAIMQSGTGNMEWVFQNQPEYKTRRLAELLGAEQNVVNDSKKLLKFLQSEKVTPLRIGANTMSVLTSDERRRHLPFTFKPVVEPSHSPDSFIDQDILDLLHQRETLGSLPMIMGYNSGEGMAMVTAAKKKLDVFEKDLARLVPRNLINDPNDPEIVAVTADIRDFYFNGQNVTEDRLDNLVDLFSDYHFTKDMQHAAEIHVACQTQSPLYFYRLDYVGGRNLYKKVFQNDHLRGVAHADDISYIFQMYGDQTPYEPADLTVSRNLCNLWANFARYGKPSEDWKPVQKPEQGESFQLDFMLIDKECRMERNPDAERMEFWRTMYKRYNTKCCESLKAKL
ncbi:uncharacterized protein Dwil_GK23289 [Drosophila willistoni]|uniref:carboxylesterase n=1 Tax=Drosophila willistoni TaxID=7260 RepID=B4NNC1_DROWI|nr:esterase-6 [Drosophila willistoni]EDW85860.1 uncharacterized protein Dwil_GK23289 [Drosophila willistoni]